MRRYNAKIITNNATITRTITASNLENAKEILSSSGEIIAISEESKVGLGVKFRRIDSGVLAIYIRQIGTLMEAGVSVLEAFSSVAQGCHNPILRKILDDISSDLHSGLSLEQALSGFKSELGAVSVAMFALGQNSGRLPEALFMLSDMLNEMAENKAKFKRALRYPMIVLLSLIIAFNLLIVMVVPSFAGVFAAIGGELPLATRILLGLESFIASYGFLALFGIILIGFLIWYFYRFNSKFRIKFDNFLLKIPLLKGLILYGSLTKFSLILSRLISAGMSIDKAINIANGVVENNYISSKIAFVAMDIHSGQTLSKAFEGAHLYEKIAIEIIKAGQTSGVIDEMFAHVSKFYKQKYDTLIDGLNGSLEPVLLIAIAGAVLLLGLGIFMPLWELSSGSGLY